MTVGIDFSRKRDGIGKVKHPPPPTQEKPLIHKSSFVFTLIIFLALTIISIKIISADVLSQNSGGSENLSVSTDKYIEGFFFVGICGDGFVDSSIGETCDDNNEVSGDGCSATCQTEPPVGEGGGGAAGGGGATGTAVYITVSPEEFNINLAVNTTTERTIRVTNTGPNTIAVAVYESNLGNHVILEEENLTISSGQSVNLRVIFVALSQPGVFGGTINVDGVPILVSLNVKTQLLLFDSNIIVLNPEYKVPQEDELKTRVTLVPLGDPERLDVGLFFTIRDYAGKIYLTKSETLLVDRLTSLDRNFDTGTLPQGDFIIALELRYPNGVAPSSAHFEVTEKRPSLFGKIILFLVSLILIMLIAIIIIIWRRRRKKEGEEENV